MSFDKILRQLRRSNRLTMKELGAKFNLAESTISGYETGIRKPDIDTLIEISKFFGVSVDYLLDIENPEQVIIEDWLLEIHFTQGNKKEVLKNIWNQIKNL